jgi:hypothetical protein
MLEEEAHYYGIALAAGLLTKQEVIAWADEKIAALAEPPEILLDISLAENRGTGEVVDLLKNLIKSNIDKVSTKSFERLALLLKKRLDKQKISTDEVASALYALWNQSAGLPEHYESFCLWVDDEFSLVRQGIKERSSAEEELSEFLAGIEKKIGNV